VTNHDKGLFSPTTQHVKELVIMARSRGLVRSVARTMGRTAAIAGTATAVSGRVAHHQQKKFASNHQAAAAIDPTPFRSGDNVVGQLQQLADLRASGALTEKEFGAAKTKLLQG
jgi:hypothetical protein